MAEANNITEANKIKEVNNMTGGIKMANQQIADLKTLVCLDHPRAAICNSKSTLKRNN